MDEFVKGIIDEEVEDPDIHELVLSAIKWEEDNIHSQRPQVTSFYMSKINEVLGFQDED